MFVRDLYKHRAKEFSFFFPNVNTVASAEINSTLAKDKEAIEHLAVVLMGERALATSALFHVASQIMQREFYLLIGGGKHDNR